MGQDWCGATAAGKLDRCNEQSFNFCEVLPLRATSKHFGFAGTSIGCKFSDSIVVGEKRQPDYASKNKLLRPMSNAGQVSYSHALSWRFTFDKNCGSLLTSLTEGYSGLETAMKVFGEAEKEARLAPLCPCTEVKKNHKLILLCITRLCRHAEGLYCCFFLLKYTRKCKGWSASVSIE